VNTQTTAPLAGYRVVEAANGIPGGYCGKLLADAGADVVKVEPPGGDPTRARHDGFGAGDGDPDSPLFRFLAASKRSAPPPPGGADLGERLRALSDAADVLIEDGFLDDAAIARLRAARPALVIVSITPFGRTGPDAGRPATEFTLQARCGSTGGRGLPGSEPIAAGGRIGEWMAGGYAAVAALAAARVARRTGVGDHADVSILESMASTMQTYGSVTASLFAAAGREYPGLRTLETPSIEPTADGHVGFCLGTGQQLRDFLMMLERADLIEDHRFATMGERNRHRAEFEEIVRTWTSKRNTADIVELASALRIPVAEIGTPSTVTSFEQFRERGVFVANPRGGFAQPRVPYRLGSFAGVAPSPAPAAGAHTDAIDWTPRNEPPPRAAPSASRPLAGLRVLDLTAFWAGPSATLTLAALGADVIKVESHTHPDGMRLASARTPDAPAWWEWGMVYFGANAEKRAITLDLTTTRGRALLLDLVEHVDVVMENFSPRVLDNLDLTWDVLRERNARVVLLRMPAFGLDGPWRDRTGFAQTMEQISGMAWMTGRADGPPVIPRGPCDPNAGTHAVFALLAALEQRDVDGTGVLIESTMVEATLNVAAEALVDWTADGVPTRRTGNRGPAAAPQGLYRCAGEDAWVAVAVETPDQWAALVGLVGAEGMWTGAESTAQRHAEHDRIDEWLSRWCGRRSAVDVDAALVTIGVPAAEVVPPHAIERDVQLEHRGFLNRVEHPITGSHRVPGLPFRLESVAGPWISKAAPTLGEHNREILAGLLGMSAAEVGDLAARGVIGTRPAGW
jgi:crotonobetainyl-CoA:carnitine CoA-transferase CaiB-like acyl-CoA transferase